MDEDEGDTQTNESDAFIKLSKQIFYTIAGNQEIISFWNDRVVKGVEKREGIIVKNIMQ